MQTRAQSLLEVSLDFVVSILVNIVGQLVFYPAQATMARVTFFSGIFLPLAFGRRWCIRRLFERWTPRDQQQPRWLSALEAISDTMLGFGLAIVLQFLIYSEVATLLRASSLTVGLYLLTMLRRYVIRRLFVAWTLRSMAGADNGARARKKARRNYSDLRWGGETIRPT
jgi:hypothetical protein